MDIIFKETNDYTLVPMDLLLLADPSEKMLAKYFPKGRYFIALLNDKVVAELVTFRTNTDTIEIMNVAVKEELQGKGIGKGLVSYAVEELKKDTSLAYIEIGTGNPGAQQMMLYQKCGFRIVGVDFDFFRRNYDEKIIENGIECRDMIRMRIDLKTIEQ